MTTFEYTKFTRGPDHIRFGVHVHVNFPLGTVSSRLGPFLMGSGFFEFIISGRGGHSLFHNIR